ncbi:DMT family transporter [Sporolactobacillus shoreae]|uniref:DMT family transporter n=1 Tax=Sporolactobacillus shoreae TaxID=1465501 RepID=A0A4Z0GLY6_9BACL|nr:DMT family transporter [Sporolactobacillus shoreae]TGA98024.1 DMT family transporter [Sporolactobacillus shoreae]
MILLFVVGGLIAGTIIPVQTSINSKLGLKVGSPFLASLISFFIGTLTLLILTLSIDHRLTFAEAAFNVNPWWVWVGGGVLGVCYLTSNILLLPRLGAALTVVTTLCGQMIMAICIDQFGWFGVPVHEFNMTRLIGVACMLVGVVLMKRF